MNPRFESSKFLARSQGQREQRLHREEVRVDCLLVFTGREKYLVPKETYYGKGEPG